MITKQLLLNKNLVAFLSTISFSEGTNTPVGYRTIFGGTKSNPILFDSFTDHPRRVINVNGLRSDAAGRYQLMSYTFDELKVVLGITDFSPDSQDLCACQLLNERNSLNDVCNGNFDTAVQKLCTIWASFPDASKAGRSHYGGQPSHTIDILRTAYMGYGGIVTST